MTNSCDGCQKGLPVVKGIHQDGQVFGIACTKHLYEPVGEDTRPKDRVKQGISGSTIIENWDTRSMK
jgi:hypothetical protein